MAVIDAPLYQVQDVRKQYASGFALCVEQLAVQAGEILCLLGPTGAGKSTLLRLLAGLDEPSQGQCRFQHGPLSAGELPLNVQRQFTMVFQRPLLLRGTVRQNIEYGLRLRGQPDDARVTAMIDRLRLATIMQQAAHSLSSGQQHLVALARALVLHPHALLLDEPTANLDPAHVALVEEVVTEAQRERNMTVVWATHNLFQARRVADRVALLLHGRLIETADTSQFFDAPSDPRTADFVQGKMIC